MLRWLVRWETKAIPEHSLCDSLHKIAILFSDPQCCRSGHTIELLLVFLNDATLVDLGDVDKRVGSLVFRAAAEHVPEAADNERREADKGERGPIAHEVSRRIL